MSDDFGVPRDAYLEALHRELGNAQAAGNARRAAAVKGEIDRVSPPVQRQAGPVETATTPKPRSRKA